jgi:hypothetical protein
MELPASASRAAPMAGVAVDRTRAGTSTKSPTWVESKSHHTAQSGAIAVEMWLSGILKCILSCKQRSNILRKFRSFTIEI